MIKLIKRANSHDFLKKLVELVYGKLNFATQENINKQFQEENKLDILMEIIRLLRIEILLTLARQIIIINLHYNTCLSNQAKKRISQIEQSNGSTTHIFVCINITITQQIRKRHDQCQKILKMTMKKT